MAKTYIPVIILGAHKSGTSALAEVIQRLGYNLGDDLLEADNFNVYGHFEDKDFIKLNELLIEKAGGAWHMPPTRLMIRKVSAEHRDEIKQLLSKKGGGEWGWKDPRTSLTLSAYLPMLDDYRLIVCRRDNEKTAQSLHRRDKDNKGYNCTPDYARLLTDYYNDEINSLLFSIDPNKYLEVQYEDLLNNPYGSTSRLAAYLGINSERKIKHASKAIRTTSHR